MTPRQYDMSKREAARAETRRRIVEATAKLHGERGVFGTSWQEIAEEADVSVATVYNHFPSLDELLPACGALVMERARPPRAQDAARIIGEAETRAERLCAVARELFAYYERGGPHLEVDVRERELIPGMREWEDSERSVVSTLVAAALGPIDDQELVERVSALFDPPTYRAMRARGLSAEEAADTAAGAAACLADKGVPTRAAKRSRETG